MFNKKKKMIKELQLENNKISNENYQLKSSLDALNISYGLLEEKYKLACKERDELKTKLDKPKKKK